MANQIDFTDDMLDIQDIIERFEELESLSDDLDTAKEEFEDAKRDLADIEGDSDYDAEDIRMARETLNECWEAVKRAKDAFDPDEHVEFVQLKALLGDLCGYGGDHQWNGDWYPDTLINDRYFKEYAMQLADDIGAINSEANWPNNCIDWDRAARELQMDYSSIEIEGRTFWYR